MTISRMQQPRQMYGLGSLVKSVTKGVKSAVSGVADAVKDVAKSDVGKLALLYAGTAGLGSLAGGGGLSSLLKLGTYKPATVFGNIPGIFSAKGLSKIGGAFGLGSTKDSLLGNVLKVGAAGTILGGALSGMPGQDVVEMTDQGRSQQDIESIRIRLTKAYRELGYPEDQIPALVEADLSEYSTRGFADGGRIGFQQGGNFDFNQFLQDRTREAMQVEGIGQAIRPIVESNVRAQAAKDLSQAARGGGIESFLRGKLGSGIIPGMSAMQSPMTGTSKFGRQQVIDALTKLYMNQYRPSSSSAAPSFSAPKQIGNFVPMEGGQFGDPTGFDQYATYGFVIDGKRYKSEQEAIDDLGVERYNMFMADGGRIGYAYGDRAEDNAIQASNAMGLPLNQNPAGVTELDLRKTGGFIPPVGVKEKADDIPAMLSNNEFVFTADAVRGMGNGDVNKGAQRMYDMMKKLENGGRV